MKVSIITVAFNSAATVRDTIESVLAQDYQNIEYIVIDGGSADGTVEIVKSYGTHIAKLRSEADEGIYDAMNKGIALATGDIIGILNSDDYYENERVISSVVHAFRTDNIDVVFGDLVFVDKKEVSRVKRYYSSKSFRPWKLKFGWMPPHSATFVRKSVYKMTGPYAIDYKIAADYEMFVRMLLLHNTSFCWLPQVFVRMRMGGVSTKGVKNSWLLNKEIVRACRTNNIYTNIFFVLSKIPFKMLEFLRKPKLG